MHFFKLLHLKIMLSTNKPPIESYCGRSAIKFFEVSLIIRLCLKVWSCTQNSLKEIGGRWRWFRLSRLLSLCGVTSFPRQIPLGTFLRLLLTDLQIKIWCVIADKAHMMCQHRQLSDNLCRCRIAQKHDALGNSVKLIRNDFDGRSFLHGVSERNDFLPIHDCGRGFDLSFGGPTSGWGWDGIF